MSHFPSVLLINGTLEPGRIHTLILSDSSLNKNYKVLHNVCVDENIKNVGKAILKLISAFGYAYLSLKNDNLIEGRSWEMAAAKAIIGEPGTYTGTVEAFDANVITYGPVPGMNIKLKMSSNLVSSSIVKFDLLSRYD